MDRIFMDESPLCFHKIERSEDSKSGEGPAFEANARQCIYTACPCYS